MAAAAGHAAQPGVADAGRAPTRGRRAGTTARRSARCPLPANVKRNRKRRGTIALNHSVLFRKTAPRMAPGHRAEPADHHHRERPDALDRGEDVLARAPAGGARAGRPRTTRRTPRARTRAAWPAVGLRRNACASRSFSRVAMRSRTIRDRWSPRTATQHEEQADGHDVVEGGARSRCRVRRTATTAGAARPGR